jgi:hypothetical protein
MIEEQPIIIRVGTPRPTIVEINPTTISRHFLGVFILLNFAMHSALNRLLKTNRQKLNRYSNASNVSSIANSQLFNTQHQLYPPKPNHINTIHPNKSNCSSSFLAGINSGLRNRLQFNSRKRPWWWMLRRLSALWKRWWIMLAQRPSPFMRVPNSAL